MFQATIRVTESTDIEEAIEKFLARTKYSDIPSVERKALNTQFSSALKSLVIRGRELQSVGARMDAKREITGEDFYVTIVFKSKRRVGFLGKLLKE